MYKVFSVLFFVTSFQLTAFSQDDLMNMLDDNAPKQKEFVNATFKGTRNINFHTCEVAGRRSLDFRISHHFGDLNGGAYQFFGMDGGASIRLGLEYSYDGRLQFGLGRSSYEKVADGFIKYKLMRQTTDNKNPITITLFSGMYYTMIKDPNKAATGIDRYQYASSRVNYCHQIIFARKFSSRFSLQLAPAFVHYNMVDFAADKNDMYSISAATRYKFTKRSAITFEYAYRLNKYSTTKYYDSVGIGVDIETGGHVFQMFLTNSIGMIEPQFIGHTTTDWRNLGLKIGFNISRVFSI